MDDGPVYGMDSVFSTIPHMSHSDSAPEGNTSQKLDARLVHQRAYRGGVHTN